MEKFVCDLGFSTAKWMDDKTKGRVPSVYVQRGGQDPLVGEEALTSPGGVSYLRATDQLVRTYPWFLEKCLDAAGTTGEVKVAVGLPAQYWREQKATKGGAIDCLEQTLLSSRVKEVNVLPQGMGGIRAYTSTQKDVPEGLILGVDIGFNTIIYTLFNPANKKVLYDHTMCERGVSQLVAMYLMPKILDFTSGKPITPPEVAIMMETGYFTNGFNRIDMMPEIRQAATEYTEDIIQEIMETVKVSIPITHFLGTALFFGGGAAHLKNQNSEKVKVMVLPEPEYANARGFMNYLER